MNLTSPIFLQAASSHHAQEGGVIKLKFNERIPMISMYGSSNITITSIYNGQKHIDTYDSLTGSVVLLADANTLVTINGDIAGSFGTVTPTATSIIIKNAELTELFCSYCSNLKELNLGNLTTLDILHCSHCSSLTTLDVSGNVELTELFCSYCSNLKELNLGNLTTLGTLHCSHCSSLTTLDVSGNAELTELSCDYCSNLKELNLSELVEYYVCSCTNCSSLTTLAIPMIDPLGSFDCSACVNLTTIDAHRLEHGNAGDYLPSISNIKARAIDSDTATHFAGLITAALSTTGKVYLNSEDEYYSTIADAATAKGWSILPLAQQSNNGVL